MCTYLRSRLLSTSFFTIVPIVAYCSSSLQFSADSDNLINELVNRELKWICKNTRLLSSRDGTVPFSFHDCLVPFEH